MRKAFMIAHQVREPSALPIQLLTQFENLDEKEANPAQTIARFFLYTKSSVYQAELKKIDINNQLAWNEKCISALTDSLSGRRSNIDIRFNEEIEDVRHSEMSLICQIETSINVRLFQIVMFKIPEVSPMNHMKRVFMNYKDVYLDQEKRLKQEKERILLETKECVALEKQIEEQTLTEIAHIKKNFIDVINVCKKQLRKHMKSGITDFINQQEQIAEEQTISKRKIVRVNRQALQNAGASKTQTQQQEKQDESLDMLFK